MLKEINYPPYLARLTDPEATVTGQDFAECLNLFLKLREPYTASSKRHFTDRPVVYALFQGRELAYIGRTLNLRTRLYAHATRTFGKKFDSFAAIIILQADLDVIEHRLIRTLAPPLNVKYREPATKVGGVLLDDLAGYLQVPVGKLFRLCVERGIAPARAKSRSYPLIEVLQAIGKSKDFFHPTAKS